MHRPAARLPLMAVWCVLLPLASSPALAVDQFNVYLGPSLPDTVYVGLDSTVNVYLQVDSTAKEFNGFEVQIQFAPSVLSFVEATEGALFPDACPNRFTPSSYTDSTVTYGDFLLCNNVSVNGPGILTVYTFNVLNLGVSPITIISNPDRSFYDAGFYVWPQNPTYPRQVVFHNAVVKVVSPTSGVSGPRETSVGDRPSLWLAPNPIRDQGEIRAVLPLTSPSRSADGPPLAEGSPSGPTSIQLSILTATGRVVSTWEQNRGTSGELVIPWKAIDRTGRALPDGMYFCRLRSAGETATARFLVVR